MRLIVFLLLPAAVKFDRLHGRLYGRLHRDAFAQRIQRGVPIFHQDHDGGAENLFPNLYSLQSRHAVPGTAVKVMAST